MLCRCDLSCVGQPSYGEAGGPGHIQYEGIVLQTALPGDLLRGASARLGEDNPQVEGGNLLCELHQLLVVEADYATAVLTRYLAVRQRYILDEGWRLRPGSLHIFRVEVGLKASLSHAPVRVFSTDLRTGCCYNSNLSINISYFEDCLLGVPQDGRRWQQNNLELGQDILRHGELGLLLHRLPGGQNFVLTKHGLLRQQKLPLNQPAVQ